MTLLQIIALVVVCLVLLNVICTYGVFVYTSRAKKQEPLVPREESSSTESTTQPISQNEEIITEQTRFVLQIIYQSQSISHHQKQEAVRLYPRWLAFADTVRAQASRHSIAILKRMRKNNRRLTPHTITGEKPSGTLFMQNIFTDLFPSRYDMADAFIMNRFYEVIILSGIPKEESQKFILHKRAHFVHHKLQQAIVLFDIYEE